MFNKRKFQEETQQQILMETKMLRDLNHHPGICPLLEQLEDAENMYFVLQYFDKGDLIKFFKTNFLFDETELKKFVF